MSKETIKVVEINTDPAKKSIKDLRKELMELKNQMANLEEGGDEFLEIANKAGELKHQLDEINESVKGASADFGDMVGNVTNVAAGLTGAFQAVAGGLQAMGLESKALDETIKRMQGLMAVTQGLSSIDTAIKSLNKLQKSITATTGAARLLKAALQPKVFLAVTAAVSGLFFIFNKLKGKVEEVKEAQEAYNEKLKEERVLYTNNKADERLRYLNRELRIKEAIASVKYGDDELKYKKEMLTAYTNELARAEANIRNTEAFDPGEAYYNQLGIDRATFIANLKKERDQIKELVEQTQDDIAVITAKNAELAKLPKTTKTSTDKKTKEEKLAELGLVEFTDEDLQEGLERVKQYWEGVYDIQLEQNKRSEKKDAEKLAEEIRIEKERLTLYKEGTLEYERQLTKISELEKGKKGAIEEALQNDRLTEMAKGWLYNEETAIETFDRISEELKLALDKDLITQEQYDTAVKNLAKERSRYIAEQSVKAFASTANFVTTILDGIADQQDQNNKEGFEKSKKLQIASATIQMFTGIATALAGAFTTKSGPWDIALAAIQAATIAASGILNINKIKNTTFDGGGSATPSAGAVNATIVPPVQYSQAVQGASTEGAIANQKVYVTESDIVDTIGKVSVQETENTY